MDTGRSVHLDGLADSAHGTTGDSADATIEIIEVAVLSAAGLRG